MVLDGLVGMVVFFLETPVVFLKHRKSWAFATLVWLLQPWQRSYLPSTPRGKSTFACFFNVPSFLGLDDNNHHSAFCWLKSEYGRSGKTWSFVNISHCMEINGKVTFSKNLNNATKLLIFAPKISLGSETSYIKIFELSRQK